jgi:predicted RNase H-like HicB family nuclease
MQKNIRKSKSAKPSPPSAQAKPTDYQVVLHWSDEDDCFIATIPAWQNVKTHGATVEQASRNALDVLAMLIPDAKKAARSRLHLRRAMIRQREKVYSDATAGLRSP